MCSMIVIYMNWLTYTSQSEQVCLQHDPNKLWLVDLSITIDICFLHHLFQFFLCELDASLLAGLAKVVQRDVACAVCWHKVVQVLFMITQYQSHWSIIRQQYKLRDKGELMLNACSSQELWLGGNGLDCNSSGRGSAPVLNRLMYSF